MKILNSNDLVINHLGMRSDKVELLSEYGISVTSAGSSIIDYQLYNGS